MWHRAAFTVRMFQPKNWVSDSTAVHHAHDYTLSEAIHHHNQQCENAERLQPRAKLHSLSCCRAILTQMDAVALGLDGQEGLIVHGRNRLRTDAAPTSSRNGWSE